MQEIILFTWIGFWKSNSVAVYYSHGLNELKEEMHYLAI